MDSDWTGYNYGRRCWLAMVAVSDTIAPRYGLRILAMILARRKVYTAKNKIMTDGKHKFMHLEWTAPDVQNVTGN